MEVKMAELAGLTSLMRCGKEKDPCKKIKCPSRVNASGCERELFIMRHGERVDQIMTDWIAVSFSKEGKYKRVNLNQPVTLPKRKGAPDAFGKDTPLSNVGLLQARLMGEDLALSKTYSVSRVFCSPAYRSLQTSFEFLKGLGVASEVPICVEPGCFEWLAAYPAKLPRWMTINELTKAGFNVDPCYKPIFTVECMRDRHEKTETLAMYYDRGYQVVTKMLEKIPNGGNILIVGHASTPDVFSRKLIGCELRPKREVDNLIAEIPYCAFLRVHYDGRCWTIQKPPVASISQNAVRQLDWKIWLESERDQFRSE